MNNRDSRIERILGHFRRGDLSRREALRALGAVGLIAGAGRLLDFQAIADEAGKQAGPGGIPLSRPDKPVTLPLNGSPIASGMQPESGTFQIFNYQDYVDQKSVIDTFAKKYNVEVQLTTFDTMDQAITRLASGAVDIDATNITPDRIAQAVAGKLLAPLNHDYIPNLKNAFKSAQNPFYDQGAQYTVPYNLYSTGIGWRNDKIKEDISKRDNPWSVFWDPKTKDYTGYTGILDDPRESLGMAMLYKGFTDLNTEDPDEIEKALADLKAAVPISNPKVNITEYKDLAEGTTWMHQSWSGDLLGAAIFYMPEGTKPDVLSFWWPGKGKGAVQGDAWALLAKSKKPVLGHLWLNHLLDHEVAYNNFTTFTGYQPAQPIDADQLIKDGILPANLKNLILTEEDLGPGSLQYCQLTAKGTALWQNAYARFSSGA
ncbi:MAG TPA: spermidine/putrescine ABC transporter substrate-binding protein [Dongiaceae bacterium]|nr:spermidine/putrescine ABC transporter substrate-binding protein [Dongiaceae bacterium]